MNNNEDIYKDAKNTTEEKGYRFAMHSQYCETQESCENCEMNDGCRIYVEELTKKAAEAFLNLFSGDENE